MKMRFLIIAVVAFLGATQFASAKEVASGGTPVSTTCNPVSSISYKGDARVGELGFASIDMKYSVKPCDSNAVTVKVELIESSNGTVVYSNSAAPLSSTITVNGVKVNTSYTIVVSVYDASTGNLVGTSKAFAAAKTKPV